MAATLLRRSFQSRHLSTLSSSASFAGKSKLSSPFFGSKWSSLTRSFSSRLVRNDVIGIDLGTTNSRIAVMEGKPTLNGKKGIRRLSTPLIHARTTREMASPGKRGRSGKSFIWTDEYRLVLLRLCANFKATHGPLKAYKWGELSSEFTKITGTPVTRHVCQSKMNQMKIDYGIWKKLKSSETHLGYDPTEGHILADPLWWEQKIKEKKEYRKFKTRGVPKEVEDIWETLFDDSLSRVDVPSNAINFDEVEETAENTLIRDDLARDDLDPGFVNLMAHISTPNSAPAETMRGEAHKKQRRRLLSKQDIVLEHMGAMRGHMDAFMGMVKSNTPSKNDALEILYRMANNGIIERRSTLFGYSLTVLMDEKIQKMFMAVNDDEDRKFFLLSQYEMNVPK